MNLKAGINLALISMLRAGWGKPQLSPAGTPGAALLWPPGVPAGPPGQIRLCVRPGKHPEKQQEQRICLWQILLLCRNRESVQQGRKGDSQNFGGGSPVPIAWTPSVPDHFYSFNTTESLR